jgi:hypothetical protein
MLGAQGSPHRVGSSENFVTFLNRTKRRKRKHPNRLE